MNRPFGNWRAASIPHFWFRWASKPGSPTGASRTRGAELGAVRDAQGPDDRLRAGPARLRPVPARPGPPALGLLGGVRLAALLFRGRHRVLFALQRDWRLAGPLRPGRPP